MRRKWIGGVVLAAFCWSTVSPAAVAAAETGEQPRSIVRVKAGLDGLKVLGSVCGLLGCTVFGPLDTPPGSTQRSELVLVGGLVDTVVTLLLSLLGLAAIEPDLPVEITHGEDTWASAQASAAVVDGGTGWGSSQASAAVVDQLWNRDPVTYYGTPAWESYLRQPASDIVRVRDAHCDFRATGATIVSVIDTGVDLEHPTLKPVLVPGYDFVSNKAGGGESTTGVTQASAAVVDGVNWVNPATVAAVDQASAAVVDDPDHAAFGHGTMVAGAVHLVAPTAKILPIRAFSANGEGRTSDILRGIYYSVYRGAKVLNMSFSRPTKSKELEIAVNYATARGLIAIASVGNEGTTQLRYPAAYDNVIGVASTSNQDVRSGFSNYGNKQVFVAAPGEGVITTYPAGTFAGAWGTSFSTPLVSGTAALLAGIRGSATNSQVASLLAKAQWVGYDMGYGRMDVYRAVQAGRAQWGWYTQSAVPATCSTHDVDWTAE
jgi:hypothetical protein